MKTHLLQPVLAVVFVPLLFSSCLVPMFVRVPRHVPFNESEFAGYGRSGSGSVSGQLVLNIEGTQYTGGGETITLVPVTTYTQEMVDRELGQGALLTPADSRLKKYVKKTRADSAGNFRFDQVPAGRYFVVGLTGYNDSSNDNFVYQWGCERITVGSGQSVRIQVTHNPAKPDAWAQTDRWTAE